MMTVNSRGLKMGIYNNYFLRIFNGAEAILRHLNLLCLAQIKNNSIISVFTSSRKFQKILPILNMSYDNIFPFAIIIFQIYFLKIYFQVSGNSQYINLNNNAVLFCSKRYRVNSKFSSTRGDCNIYSFVTLVKTKNFKIKRKQIF